MPQRVLNGLFLLRWALRHSAAFRLRLVAALPLDDPVLSLLFIWLCVDRAFIPTANPFRMPVYLHQGNEWSNP